MYSGKQISLSMNQNFFSNPGIQQVLKKSNKIIAAYNNKHGSFLIYPLFRNYTIIYACQKQTPKNTPYIQKLAKRHNSIYTVIETLNQIEHFEKKSLQSFCFDSLNSIFKFFAFFIFHPLLLKTCS